ncbi:hypothetical protein CLD22_28775, partial [Rubrivivax gelatinosus]|nr:hypothetical protein [Rubrivivax gelatinosus]
MKPYRLFWKLFFAFWVAMMLTFAGTIGFFLTTGAPPPPPDGDALLRPIVPIVSAVVTSLSASLLLAWYLT